MDKSFFGLLNYRYVTSVCLAAAGTAVLEITIKQGRRTGGR
jgi:hypothetical protein